MEIFLSDLAQQHRRTIAEIRDIYFTLIDAAGISQRLVWNQNAKTKERGNWNPFKL